VAGPAPYDDEDVDRSLLEDVEELIADGKGYLEAELAYQKTRAAFVAGGVKGVAVLGAVAAVLAVMALMGLTLGLILALTPLITAWGATAVVVGLLLLGAWLAARAAGARWRRITAAAADRGTAG
jgi:hypothetical protein